MTSGVRAYFRTGRRSGVSVGPLGTLVVGLGYLVYLSVVVALLAAAGLLWLGVAAVYVLALGGNGALNARRRRRGERIRPAPRMPGLPGRTGRLMKPRTSSNAARARGDGSVHCPACGVRTWGRRCHWCGGAVADPPAELGSGNRAMARRWPGSTA